MEVAGARCARRSHRHFWEDLGVLLEARPAVDPEKYRREVMARSAAYLGLDPSQAAAFQGAATLALAEIQDAWTTRDAEVLGLPASLRADERTQMEQGIQERYETAKQRASARLESLLGTTGRHDQFRRNLGEWIDAVR